MNGLSRFATAVVVSGAVGLAALGLAGGTAQAGPAWGPSYQGGNCPGGLTCTHWCPGDPLIPGSQVITWDWNICHDWYWNSEGMVDVAPAPFTRGPEHRIRSRRRSLLRPLRSRCRRVRRSAAHAAR